MNHKQQLDFYITEHYDYLLRIARNITQRVYRRKIKYDLLHQVILQLYQRLENNYDYLKSETDFKKYVTKFLKQHYEWEKSYKHRLKKDNALFTFEQTCEEKENFNQEFEADDKAEEMIYITAENTNDITKLFLKDMCLNDIPIEKGLMVNKIMDAAKTLSIKDYQIFDMCFIQSLTVQQIYLELKSKNTSYPGYHTIRKWKKNVHQQIIDKLKW